MPSCLFRSLTAICKRIHLPTTGIDGYVWENSPLKIKVDAYKAPFAYTRHTTRTDEICEELLDATDRHELTLVPYGCTALRITYFHALK